MIFEPLAGAEHIVTVGVAQLWVVFDLRAVDALDVRKPQHVHRLTNKGQPNKLRLGEKLQRWNVIQQIRLQQYNVGPALMVAGDQVPLFGGQMLPALPVNFRFDESQHVEHPTIRRGPPNDDSIHPLPDLLLFFGSRKH